MRFKGLFSKKLSIKQGEELLSQYCQTNGFGDITTHWKKPTYCTNWFAYLKKPKSGTMVANNWVAYHPIRSNNRYTIWIDLVTSEIREILK